MPHAYDMLQQFCACTGGCTEVWVLSVAHVAACLQLSLCQAGYWQAAMIPASLWHVIMAVIFELSEPYRTDSDEDKALSRSCLMFVAFDTMMVQLLLAAAGGLATCIKLRRKRKHRHHKSTWSDKHSKPVKLRVYNDCSFLISLYWCVTTCGCTSSSSSSNSLLLKHCMAQACSLALGMCLITGSTMKGRFNNLGRSGLANYTY
jgi:hypothetical protein